jgi:hypothetical protein
VPGFHIRCVHDEIRFRVDTVQKVVETQMHRLF